MKKTSHCPEISRIDHNGMDEKEIEKLTPYFYRLVKRTSMINARKAEFKLCDIIDIKDKSLVAFKVCLSATGTGENRSWQAHFESYNQRVTIIAQ